MTWKDFINLLPYYSKEAECMRCHFIHRRYKFSPKQLYYNSAPMDLLYCYGCESTTMHHPVERKNNVEHKDIIKFATNRFSLNTIKASIKFSNSYVIIDGILDGDELDRLCKAVKYIREEEYKLRIEKYR